MSLDFSPGSAMPSLPNGPTAPGGSKPPPTPLVEIWLEVPAAEVEWAAAILELVSPAGVATTYPFEQGLDFGEATIRPDVCARVSCYLPTSDWQMLRPTVDAAVAAAAWSHIPPQVHAAPLPDRDWATAWHAHVRVQRFGRLVLRPTPCSHEAQQGQVIVTLEPGLAFGSGTHESTRLALIALERWLRPGDKVLDLGTGSGVLACAAARLGAARVDAVDIDPLALDAAKRNAHLNGVEGSIVAVQLGDRPPPCQYDFIVANITARAIIALADSLAAALYPTGICVAGGIIDTQLGEVKRALQAAGLQPEHTLSEGGWRSIQAVRA